MVIWSNVGGYCGVKAGSMDGQNVLVHKQFIVCFVLYFLIRVFILEFLYDALV